MPISLNGCCLSFDTETVAKAFPNKEQSLEDLRTEAIKLLVNLKEIDFGDNHQQIVEGNIGVWYCRKNNDTLVLVLASEGFPLHLIDKFYEEYDYIQTEYNENNDEAMLDRQLKALVLRSNSDLNTSQLVK